MKTCLVLQKKTQSVFHHQAETIYLDYMYISITPNRHASLLASACKLLKKPFECSCVCCNSVQKNLCWLVLGVQMVKNVHLLALKFDLNQSEHKTMITCMLVLVSHLCITKLQLWMYNLPAFTIASISSIVMSPCHNESFPFRFSLTSKALSEVLPNNKIH